MRFICFYILLACCCNVFGQTGEIFTVQKSEVKPGLFDNALYYAPTPPEDVCRDSAYTYFLFLPARTVCWFYSCVPPQAQNPVRVSGLIVGTCEYSMVADTLTFSRFYNNTKGFDSGEDRFTCIITAGGMKAMMEEFITGRQSGEVVYFYFKQYKK